jgi:integrase
MTTALQINGKKRGRKSKPYKASDGSTIDGLYRCPDGRWRINATGEKYTCHDEGIAIAKFRHWQAKQKKTTAALPLAQPSESVLVAQKGNVIDLDDATFVDVGQVDEAALVQWARRQLLTRAVWFAEATGFPGLANADLMTPPPASIQLSDLIDAYMARTGVEAKSLNNAKAAWKNFVQITGATTLRELTTEALLNFDRWLKAHKEWSDVYRLNIIKKIRSVISYGRKRGMNAEEIGKALDRMIVVERPTVQDNYTANPISKADWQTLYGNTEGKAVERAMVLMGLNCAFYLQDLSDVQWSEIDLEAATLVMARGKTGFLRVATLWPETVAALQAIRPANAEGSIFRSRHGTAYKAHSLRNLFNAIRPTGTEFNQLRDAAQTAAVRAEISLPLVKLLAGHAIGGETDKYIARGPEMVAPACEAIRAAYMK